MFTLPNQLNSVNNSFNKLLKLNTNSPEYAKIAFEYERIVQLALDTAHSSNQIKLIGLAARLGVIQCKMNSFELSPTAELIIQNNDSELGLLKNQLDQLNRENTAFQKKVSLRKSKTFALQLKTATNSWEKDKKNRQVAYYYNFACHILDTTTSPVLVGKAINYLEKSSALYKQNNMPQAKIETDIKIAEAKETLKELQLNSSIVPLERIKLQNAEIQISRVTLSDKDSLIAKNIDKIPNLVSNKPVVTSNKRSYPPLEINEKLKTKISKPNTSKSITNALSLLTISNEELLNLEKNIFKEIEESLEIAVFLPDNYFYPLFINNMARFIHPHSDIDRLTQLRLAEIVLYLSKSPESASLENKQQIIANEFRINCVYRDFFSSEERLKPEILQEKFQAVDGVKLLFLSEIKAYYFKRKIALSDNDSRKIFLNELQSITVKSMQAALTEGTIQTIAYQLSHPLLEPGHQLFEKLLSAILAFYIAAHPDQQKQNCLEKNNIPVQPSDLRYQDFLSKLYDLTSLYSAPGVKQIKFSHSGIRKLYFFKPQSIALTKEIFLTRLKEHLLMLKTDYIPSNNQYSAICHCLTQLITTQIDQHTKDQKPLWRPYDP